MPSIPNKTLLLFIFLVCSIFINGCFHYSGKQPPKAVKGVVDLRGWDFKKDGPIKLNGEWEFFWDRILGPDSSGSVDTSKGPAYAPVPAMWREMQWHGKRLSGEGFATYRLHVLLADTATPLALEIFQALSAFRVYWDQREIACQGVIGPTWKSSTMAYTQIAAAVPPVTRNGTVTMQVVCNYPDGGLFTYLKLGDAAAVTNGRYLAVALRALLVGCILMMALVYLAIFVFRRADIVYCYFGLMCLVFAGMFSTGYFQNVFSIFFPHVSPGIYLHFLDLCSCLSLPLIMIVVGKLFPADLPRWVVGVALGYGAVMTPISFFPTVAWSEPLQIIGNLTSIFFCIIGFYFAILFVVRKREGSIALLAGFLFLALASVCDILLFPILMLSFSVYLFGFLALLICQAIALAQRFNRTQVDLLRHREQLSHAEKLATIGTLVAGVAHEINNPNASIKLNVDMLQKSWAKLEPIHEEYAREHGQFEVGNIPYEEFKHEIVEAISSTSRNVERIKKLVDDLRTFARKDEGKFDEDVDVNTVVREAVSILGATLRKATSRLEVSYASNLPCIKGNALRFEQVVVNLLNNARQALPDSNKGIFVSTAVDQARHMVIVIVRDEGCGMDKKTLERIREPFFTTKGPAEGTGLGLSICNEIVKKHGGELKIESEPGKGTTVSIFLPVAGAEK